MTRNLTASLLILAAVLANVSFTALGSVFTASMMRTCFARNVSLIRRRSR